MPMTESEHDALWRDFPRTAIEFEAPPRAAIYAVALRESLGIPAVRTFMDHVTSRPVLQR